MSEESRLLFPSFPAMFPYLEGPYLRAIDYTRLPDPPLNETETVWVDERLRAVGLRE